MKAHLEDLLSVKNIAFRSGANIPQADLSVIRAAEQMTFLEGTPRQAITFRAVTLEPHIRVASSIKRWLRRVLAVIEQIHLRTNGLGGNHKRVLRHIASSIHLTFVNYLLDNLHLNAKAIDFLIIQFAKP